MTKHKKSARDLTNLNIFWEIQSKSSCLRSKRKLCWRYVCIYENAPKKLPHLSPKSCCNLAQSFKEGHSCIRGTGVKILEVVDWLQVLNQPSQLEPVAATRISCSQSLEASSRFLKQQSEPISVVPKIRQQKANHKNDVFCRVSP